MIKWVLQQCCMKDKGDIFHSKHYASRSWKSGMPFGSVLTILFHHHNVNLLEEASVAVYREHEISDSTLKAMHYVETINHGWVLFPYLKEDDEVPKGTRVSTPAERVTRRGPEMLMELRMGTFVRHLKIKGKQKVNVEEYEENDLVAQMHSLETAQLEIRDEVCTLRTDVRDEIHSVKAILEDFIRFSNPSFPFPTSRPD
ncbi:hypothetical protein OROHE_016878 [Orobanche hederae]